MNEAKYSYNSYQVLIEEYTFLNDVIKHTFLLG